MYCECPVCGEARTSGRNHRTRASALLVTPQGCLQLDCSPDFRSQMERVQMRHSQHILITHPHHDHIGGLPDLADVARWTGEPSDVYLPEPALEVVLRQYPWTERHLHYQSFHPGETLALLGWRICGWPVTHGANGYSYAYRLEKDGYVLVYCPDSIALTPEEKEFVADANLLVLGTNFYRETAEFHRRSVYDMVEALALIDEVKPRRTIFTHLSHGVDVRNQYPLPLDVTLASDGYTVALSG